MRDRPAKDGHLFRRALGGYRRSDVDRYVGEVETARKAWSEELARLRKVEPLARLGEDIAELLTSFAATVLARQERAREDAERRRAEAEEYAARRMADADQMLEMARKQAQELARDLVRQAQAEVALLADQQLTIAEALERAAHGIAISEEAMAKIRRLSGLSVVAPLTIQNGAGEGLPGTPTGTPRHA